MAKDNKQQLSKKLNSLVSNVQSSINNLYTSTYYNTPSNVKDLDDIRNGINASIDKIINNNVNNAGVPNISRLYSRVTSVQKDKKIINDINDVFSDTGLMDNVLGAYLENKYLKDLDNEIDTICKYFPKLTEALDTRKDNVLSADHFSKDFINVINKSNVKKDISFNDRIDYLKEEYDLLNLFEDSYEKAAKYGEQFLYIVPYKKAFDKLLNQKGSTTMAQVQTETGQILCEGQTPFKLSEDYKELFEDENYSIQLELNNTNIIASAIYDRKKAVDKLRIVSESSVNGTMYESGIYGKTNSFSKTIDDELEFEDMDTSTQDGLVSSKSEKIDKIKVPGCIIKKLDRSCVIPVYIEDICLGFYYLEFSEYDDMFNYSNSIQDPLVTMKSSSKLASKGGDNIKKDQMLKYISSQLSTFIDSKFINNNQDIRKELYMILKYNDLFNRPTSDKFRVTFIPPEDMIHIKFNEDIKTHRGISDLSKAMIPSKLYASLYVTNSIAVMTRGQDKRVYYVRQNVDTNIAQTLLNTINQIKKSNFGMRQIENINNILNITGRFNDYVIPLNPSGDAPIQFEVMPGQNIEIKTELMNMLEEMAINSTDVPLELIQARQSIDYAVQLTMTNSKFLRKVYNRQAKYEKFLSSIVTKLYNGEYEEDNILTVKLPPPMFLNITNTNQLITNTKDFVSSIWEEMVSDETDETFKVIYKRNLLKHHLGSYIDMDRYEEIKNMSKQEAALKRMETDDVAETE